MLECCVRKNGASFVGKDPLILMIYMARPERLTRASRCFVARPAGALRVSKQLRRATRFTLRSLSNSAYDFRREFELLERAYKKTTCWVVILYMARPERFELPTAWFVDWLTKTLKIQ